MAGSGAFSKWAGKVGNGDLRNFANWAYGEATSHPIDRIVTTLNTGKAAPEPDREPLFKSPTEPYRTAPIKKPVKVPEMLKSKYWTPGGK